MSEAENILRELVEAEAQYKRRPKPLGATEAERREWDAACSRRLLAWVNARAWNTSNKSKGAS